MFRRTPRLLAMTAALVATAACNGDDGAAPTTFDATTTVETMVPDTTPPTTEPPPTTAEQTTTTATTVNQTTTTSGPRPTTAVGTEEEQIVAAVTEFVDAVNEGFWDPADEAARTRVRLASTERLAGQVIEAMDSWVEAGDRAVPDADDPSRVELHLETLSSGAENSAGIDGCLIDTDVRVRTLPDGSEEVVDDTPDARLVVFTVLRVESRWVVESFVTDRLFEGQNTCG